MSGADTVHRGYIRAFIRLSLWYVHRLIQAEGIGLAEAMAQRVNIYRNTSLFDGTNHPARGHKDPEWDGVVEGMGRIFDRHAGDPSTAGLEEEGLEHLWPYIEVRMQRQRSPGTRSQPVERPYECWRYDDVPGQIHIHIGNAYRPKSPLSEMRVPFAASLIRLLRDATARRADVEVVRCGSWLNSMPRFQALFPPSWMANAIERPVSGYGMGHWGQFYDRRGGFHERNGEALRQTGRFPFPCLSCHAPTFETIAHLEERHPEAVAYNRERGYSPPSPAGSG